MTLDRANLVLADVQAPDRDPWLKSLRSVSKRRRTVISAIGWRMRRPADGRNAISYMWTCARRISTDRRVWEDAVIPDDWESGDKDQ
jgi:hypothetical protein